MPKVEIGGGLAVVFIAGFMGHKGFVALAAAGAQWQWEDLSSRPPWPKISFSEEKSLNL